MLFLKVNDKRHGPKVEFKIKDGRRHGKSIYYSKTGEELRVEKYKEGFLQED